MSEQSTASEREAVHATTFAREAGRVRTARTRQACGAGTALIAVGCICMVVAVALVAGRFAFSQAKQAESERTCAAIAEAWDAAVPAASAAAGQADASAGEPQDASGSASAFGAGGLSGTSALDALPALPVAGADVIGRLSCDAASIDVPVAAYGFDAAVVPTREPKSDGDAAKLVVRGAPYQSGGAFGRIGDLQVGTRVVFQCADGVAIGYDVVATGTTGEQFTDHFDLLAYYENERGQRVWVGCSKVS